MQTIQLKAMTRELCHELYRHWTNDASIYMDMRLFRPYVYNEAAVNRYFDEKGSDASRRLFAIMLGDQVIGELQLKQIDYDKKECTLSIHMQNDMVRVVIQHFSKNTVISMVLGHPNSEITCIPPS